MKKKRSPVPFNRNYFGKMADRGKQYSAEEAFKYIYQTNHWSGKDSISGDGSDLIQTVEVRKQLGLIVKEFDVHVFLDLPCGDFRWMSSTGLPVDRFIGADIVPELVINNKKKYGNQNREFLVLDIIHDHLPDADLLMCRDCIVHFSIDDIMESLANIKGSHIRYLLTTTFPECDSNDDIITGDWRIINLEKHPFNFPQPIRMVNEKCTEGGGSYSDKSLGLWNIGSIPV